MATTNTSTSTTEQATTTTAETPLKSTPELGVTQTHPGKDGTGATFLLVVSTLVANRAAKGDGYRGKQSITYSGLTCQKWSSQSPHRHGFYTAKYKARGIGDNNYCRNPGLNHHTTWCYTTGSMRWDWCVTPTCGEHYGEEAEEKVEKVEEVEKEEKEEKEEKVEEVEKEEKEEKKEKEEQNCSKSIVARSFSMASWCMQFYKSIKQAKKLKDDIQGAGGNSISLRAFIVNIFLLHPIYCSVKGIYVIFDTNTSSGEYYYYSRFAWEYFDEFLTIF